MKFGFRIPSLNKRIAARTSVKRLVTRLKTQGWSFNYYGTDTSVEEMKERLAFDGGMVMEKSNAGFRQGMAQFSMSSSNLKSNWLKDWMKEDFTE
jgi:hypothetical protein